MESSRFQFLLGQYQQNKLSSSEKEELVAFTREGDEQWVELLEGWMNKEKGDSLMLHKDFIVGQLEAVLSIDKQQRAMPAVHRIHFLKTAWFRYAAAIIVLLGIGRYLLWSDRGGIPAKTRDEKRSVVQSGSSSNNKAILTLADGSQIILDDKSTGNIAQQGNTKIIKLDANQLTYNSNIKTSSPAMEGTVFDPREAGQKPGVGALYNTIATPKGSQYQVILPDGTKVWLNAASSLRFPLTFAGKERKVEATGEIYFEVTVNKMQPFFVSSKSMEVQVLGTSFNINAYPEDGTLKTSLVEGAIKVNDRLLAPGQAYNNGKVVTTNLEQDIAWKNGFFNFEGLTLKQAMNQLARWYNIEVTYEGNITDIKFFGEISRGLSLPNLLKSLEESELHFRRENNGRRLVVLP